MADPAAPDAETRERLLGVLGELVARGGTERFLVAPVAPGVRAFPEPWARSRAGVTLLVRRLAAHAGLDYAIAIDDRRAQAAPPTERKPATRLEAIELRRREGASIEAAFALGFIGTDDFVGTIAHEVGVAFAAQHHPEAGGVPYRAAETPTIDVDPEVDGPRGSIAAVYLGLGVVATNAAFQQYSTGGRFNGAYEPLEYDVLRAGHLPMSELAFLLAVQSVVRGEAAPPAGLEPPQRDEVAAWIRALRDRAGELRTRFGLPDDARGTDRNEVTAFTDVALDDEDEPVEKRIAFRWRTHRGGVGLIAGVVVGVGVAVLVASRGASLYLAFGGATVGHLVGRRVHVPRCSACATIVAVDASTCRSCGASLRGDIASLSERLDAEERLLGPDPASAPDVDV